MIPPWSYTALDTFENCPKQYYHRYILKERELETEAIRWGNTVHKALELRLTERQPLHSSMLAWEPLAASVEKYAEGGALECEKAFGVDTNWKPTGFFSGDVWGRGKADVSIRKGRKVWIGDWKTGKPREKAFQVQVFAGFMFTVYPEVELVYANNIWLKDGTPGPTYKFTREGDYERIKATIAEKVETIKRCAEANKWPPRESGLCGWCGVKSCPMNPNRERNNA